MQHVRFLKALLFFSATLLGTAYAYEYFKGDFRLSRSSIVYTSAGIGYMFAKCYMGSRPIWMHCVLIGLLLILGSWIAHTLYPPKFPLILMIFGYSLVVSMALALFYSTDKKEY